MQETFTAAILRFRWWVIVLSLVFVTSMFMGLERIAILSDYKSFLDPEYPGLLQQEEVEAIFTENNRLMIAVAPQDQKVFKPTTIRLIQALTNDAWMLPNVSRVDSISNYQHTEAIGDDLNVGSFFPDDKPLSQALMGRARHVSASEPLLKDNLISARQHVAVISMTFDFPENETLSQANDRSVIAAYALLDKYRAQYPATDFHLSGVMCFDYAFGKYGRQDMATLIPGMLGLMALILLFMTRSLSSVFAAALVVIFTGVGTLGMLGWIGWIIDPGSSLSPIVIMTLAVADSIHIIEGMQKAMRMGLNKLDAIRHSLKENFAPVFLTSLTTVLGVITFTFTDFPTLERIGITVALGVSVAFALSVTLLPAALAVLPIKTKVVRSETKVFSQIGRFAIRHCRKISVVTLLIAVSLAGLAPLNRFNDSPPSMLSTRTVERQAVDFFESNVSGIMMLDVAIFSDRVGGVNNPDFLAKARDYVDWQLAQDDVDHITTLTDTFKRLNQNMHGDDPSWYRLPDERELAAQYLLLYEMSLPFGLDLNNQLNLDKSGIRTTVVLHDSDSETIYKTQQAIYAWFAANAPELRPVVTGSIVMMSEVSYLHLIPGMMNGGMIAIVMVSLVLFVALRRFKLGAMAMLANMVPLAMGYGIWYLINGQVNFIVASVAGVCLGVVVDFAVHFLSKYQRERNAGQSTENAIIRTFEKTGRPLWTTMIVLVAGFWLLMLSPVTLNFSMGCLTGIVIMLALAFDFLALPALLMVFDNNQADAVENNKAIDSI